MSSGIQERVERINWEAVEASLSESGFAHAGALLSPDECQNLISLYADNTRFRSQVAMERFRFGKGDYKYLRHPLPESVATLRKATYPHLAVIANHWQTALGERGAAFPPEHEEFLRRCHRAGQTQPTPLLLHYEAGGFNCLHQDLYGEIAFPLQLVVMLGRQGQDWEGGEFVLVENIPRAQSRAEVLTADLGHGIFFTTRYRPVKGSRGYYRVAVRHGVSRVRSGTRYTLGIIYHDAK
jgi:hypothetical protein